MLYIATVSFSGLLTMRAGEKRELADSPVVSDLLKAGHIIEYKAADTVKPADKKERKGKK